MSHRDGSEKLSVSKVLLIPGRISGVGGLVAKTPSVGVADGGNQIMVEVGSAVSVEIIGIGVAFNTSNEAQDDVMMVAIAKRRLLRAASQERRPRNDEESIFMDCVVK